MSTHRVTNNTILRRGCVQNHFSKKITKRHENKAKNAAIPPLLFLCNQDKYLPACDQWRFRVSSSANRMKMEVASTIATRHANLCMQTKIECMLEGRPDPLLAIICERNHF